MHGFYSLRIVINGTNVINVVSPRSMARKIKEETFER